MEFDLPELPFVPGSIVSEVEDEREGQYQTLQDKYVAPASTTFNSEIERCEGLQALITDDDDGMLLTDDDTINSSKEPLRVSVQSAYTIAAS